MTVETVETDPYVIYGGDPGRNTKIDESCPSLGAMVMSDFKLGGNKTCFVKLLLSLTQIQ